MRWFTDFVDDGSALVPLSAAWKGRDPFSAELSIDAVSVRERGVPSFPDIVHAQR